jgi:(p)ppGpp synthase/HD superfamily hydrolase
MTKEIKEFIVVGMLKNKNMESQLIKRARELAFCYHKNQKYGSHPYSSHLEAVVKVAYFFSYMIPEDAEEDVICAAYLHDILEDTLCTQDEILRALNPRILLLVKLLTKNGSDPEKYFSQVALDDLAIFVKLCDRYSNILASVNSGNLEKIAKYEKQNPDFIRILLRKNYIDLLEEIEELFELD